MRQQEMVFDSVNRVQRLKPLMPVGGMQTFEVRAPIATHWRTASCAEIECEHHLKGWATTVLAGSDDERLIRGSGRAWVGPERLPDGFLRYVFPSGQKCFGASRHRVRIDKPELFLLAEGDWRWRGAPRVFDRPEDWVDHFATHQDKIATIVNRG